MLTIDATLPRKGYSMYNPDNKDIPVPAQNNIVQQRVDYVVEDMIEGYYYSCLMMGAFRKKYFFYITDNLSLAVLIYFF